MTAPSLPAGRGAFIVLEGLDRSGKSTQVSRLAEEVAKVGKAVLVQKFPGMSGAWSPYTCRAYSFVQTGALLSAK